MKKLCIQICEKAQLTVEITEEMEQDLRECYKKADGEDFKDCAGCSWHGLDVTEGTPLCQIAGNAIESEKTD